MVTLDEIYAEMKSDYSSRTGIALREGGDMSVRLRALAAQLFSLNAQREWLSGQCFPQTATGTYLDYHAQLRALERGGPVCATGYIRFTASEIRGAEIIVPSGVACSSTGGVEFVTTGQGAIPAGGLTCTVQAQAAKSGSSGNVPAGSVLFMTNAPAGVVSCINDENFTGGTDSEEDESLRERILGSYRRLPNGANAAYYEAQALDVDGVAAASVLPRARGLGTVDVKICTEEGLPPENLAEAVRDKLQSQREICVDIEVSAPATQPVDVSIEVASGSKAEFVQVIPLVETVVRSYFCGRRLGKGVILAELGNIIYNVRGVTNYRIAEPVSDIAGDGGKLPVLGALSIAEMGV